MSIVHDAIVAAPCHAVVPALHPLTRSVDSVQTLANCRKTIDKREFCHALDTWSPGPNSQFYNLPRDPEDWVGVDRFWVYNLPDSTRPTTPKDPIEGEIACK